MQTWPTFGGAVDEEEWMETPKHAAPDKRFIVFCDKILPAIMQWEIRIYPKIYLKLKRLLRSFFSFSAYFCYLCIVDLQEIILVP